MRCLVVCPLKRPDHPIASGDRAVARLMLAALRRAGAVPELADGPRMFEGAGDAARQAELETAAREDAGRQLVRLLAQPAKDRPRAVFTYHCHYKAPDVVGPLLARGLGVPHLIAEPSRAPKRATGPHARFHALAEAAMDGAAVLLPATPRDRALLDRLAPPGQKILDLAPFLDVDAWPSPAGLRRARAPGPLRLLCVGMMREGRKLRSFELLAASLREPACPPVELDLVGDGPARTAVEAAFAPLGNRGHVVRMHGFVEDRARLAGFYREADLFAWPAIDEPYGMVFLEAATQGLPALAGTEGGVAAVVRNGDTGRLVPSREPAAFAAALAELDADRAELARLGRRARDTLRERHGLEGAAATLREAFRAAGLGNALGDALVSARGRAPSSTTPTASPATPPVNA